MGVRELLTMQQLCDGFCCFFGPSVFTSVISSVGSAAHPSVGSFTGYSAVPSVRLSFRPFGPSVRSAWLSVQGFLNSLLSHTDKEGDVLNSKASLEPSLVWSALKNATRI